MTNTCAICNKPAKQSCSLCNTAFYCCKDHQIRDWKKGHKTNCAPFKINTNETLGRHLVATRNIEAGELILQKSALLLCPKTASFPLCLGCHSRLDVAQFYLCTKCNWPLCGPDCEETDFHKDECRVLAHSNFQPNVSSESVKQSSYSVIGPLRALLLKETSKTKFGNLANMQSHIEKCLDTPLYKALRNSLVPLITNVLKIHTTEKEILTICSIFDTNSFDVRDSKGAINIRGLYPVVNLISHDCKCNTKHTYNDKFDMIVTATVPIVKGELITTCYTQSLWGTLARRAHLNASKHFLCSCKRCTDPAEFGTYAGSIACSECGNDKGYHKMISTDPLNANSDWKCDTCERLIPAKQIAWGNEAIKKEIAQIGRENPQNFEDFLIKYNDVLHPSNCHVLEVKYALSQMYGNMKGYLLSDLSDELLERKVQLCHDLLTVADVLSPGLSRFRGSLLYDLQAAMAVQAKRDFENGKLTKSAVNDILMDAMQVLQESAMILSSEPDMKELLQRRLENLAQIIDVN